MQRSVGSSHIFIDAANGKHIGIIHPWKSGTEFYHYTGFYSIALFAFVDFDYKFFYAEVGMAGPISKRSVFCNFNIYGGLTKNLLGFPTSRKFATCDDDLWNSNDTTTSQYFLCRWSLSSKCLLYETL